MKQWHGKVSWPFWGREASQESRLYLWVDLVDHDPDRRIEIEVTPEQAQVIGERLLAWVKEVT